MWEGIQVGKCTVREHDENQMGGAEEMETVKRLMNLLVIPQRMIQAPTPRQGQVRVGALHVSQRKCKAGSRNPEGSSEGS